MENSNRSADANFLVTMMFEEPFKYRTHVEKIVSRNKKLPSRVRRELTGFAYGAFKWKDRLWDKQPEEIDYEQIQSLIAKFQSETLEEVLQAVKQLPSIDAQAKYLSYPKWIIEKWIQDFGFEKAIEIAWIQNQNSDLCVRVNGLEDSFEKAQKTFESEGVPTRRGKVPSAFYFLKKENVRGLNSFKRGMFEIQDEHSQQVCLWAEPRMRDFIIDGCSRTGGKALHLAALQQNEGNILCADVDARVFSELENRAGRLGIKCIKTRWIAIDDPNPCPDMKGKADIVFVDAPCTGLGTIRHSPALRWNMQPESIPEFTARQKEILERQSKWVRTGGKLVYVTCSLLKEENEAIIEQFVSKHPEYKIVKQERLFPVHQGGDGFYFCMMIRG
jgi:16S rRNA (cytosine967-C5)-methyltransferase